MIKMVLSLVTLPYNLNLSPGNYPIKCILPERFVFTVQPMWIKEVTSDADRNMMPVKLLKSGDSYYSFDAGMFIHHMA
jgi:hypothetical protein